MTTRVRHPNRSTLHLANHARSALVEDVDAQTDGAGEWGRVITRVAAGRSHRRQNRRPPSRAPAAAELVDASSASTPSARVRRHELVPAGPGRGLCTACGTVFDVLAHAREGRRLPCCYPRPLSSSDATPQPRSTVDVDEAPHAHLPALSPGGEAEDPMGEQISAAEQARRARMVRHNTKMDVGRTGAEQDRWARGESTADQLVDAVKASAPGYIADRDRGTAATRADVFAEQHTPEEVTTYEVARELIGRRLGQALAEKRAATDPLERGRWAAVVTAAERQRQALRVGSAEAAQIVAEAKAARAATLAQG